MQTRLTPFAFAAASFLLHIYRERNLVERFFNKIKHFRGIATRYEKTAASFAAMLFVVGAMIWLR
jgi:transposase